MAALLGLIASQAARAAISSPYAVDADTLHLYHFEDAANATTVADAVAPGQTMEGVINGVTLANPSFNGFGSSAYFGDLAQKRPSSERQSFDDHGEVLIWNGTLLTMPSTSSEKRHSSSRASRTIRRMAGASKDSMPRPSANVSSRSTIVSTKSSGNELSEDSVEEFQYWIIGRINRARRKAGLPKVQISEEKE